MSDQLKCMVRPGCDNRPANYFRWQGALMLACSEHTKSAVATAARMGRAIEPRPLESQDSTSQKRTPQAVAAPAAAPPIGSRSSTSTRRPR